MRRAGLLAVLALLAAAAPAHAAFPGANGKIAFDCGGSICTVNPDGTGLTKLTGPPEGETDSAPQWSPDGQKIALTRSTANPASCAVPFTGDIFVMSADGTDQVNVTHSSCSDEEEPTWSADQKRIAFSSPQLFYRTRFSPNLFDIYVMSADGGGVTKLTDARTILGPPECGQLECVHFGVSFPRWSPDGAKIAFDADGVEIDTMNADGSDVTSLTTGFAHYFPNWSPDGQKIALTKETVDINAGIFNLDIATINRDGSGFAKIADTSAYEADPAWSPDGGKIVFTSSGPPVGLFVMNADGSGATFLTAGRTPDWQPVLGPRRSDYKNAAKFCNAERDFMGDEAFDKKYGTNDNGANAYGKCVSQSH